MGVLDRRERKDRRGTWYRQAKDNEARREGRRESHISIVPMKQGNLYRGDPGEGRGMLVRDLWWGHPTGTPFPGPGVNATTTDSKADGEPLTGRTGCLSWARPDLWEPREATPGATRRGGARGMR